jgi:hypothetical protein
MLKWLLGGKLRKIVENDILDARLMLSMMKLKLHKEGAEATVIYGEGVGEVAGLLSQRLGISVPNALSASGLDWQQLDDASRDLAGAIEIAGPLLKSSSPTARNYAIKRATGSMVHHHLYRLRFLAEKAPLEQRQEALVMAERVAQFARVMAEIGAGVRDPADAQE